MQTTRTPATHNTMSLRHLVRVVPVAARLTTRARQPAMIVAYKSDDAHAPAKREKHAPQQQQQQQQQGEQLAPRRADAGWLAPSPLDDAVSLRRLSSDCASPVDGGASGAPSAAMVAWQPARRPD